LPLTCMRRAASILSSRDKWRPADVPLQAVGVASLATLFIGLWVFPIVKATKFTIRTRGITWHVHR